MWTIFEPGDIVLGCEEGLLNAFVLETAEYSTGSEGGRSYRLRCKYVDWDGKNFGEGSRNLHISSFDGTITVQKLAVYPLKYHSDNDIKAKLVEKGQVFERLCGCFYKAYSGIATGIGPCGGSINSAFILITKTLILTLYSNSLGQ